MQKDTHPSNVLKYCPFCGSDAFIWNGTNAHHCNNCHHRLYTNEAGAVIALIRNAKDEILFTIRKKDPEKGTLDLPGGFINLNETAEDAVVREVKEELNVDIKQIEFLKTVPNIYPYGGLTYFTIDIVFICKVDDFSGLKPQDDVKDVLFLPLNDVDTNKIGLQSPRNVILSLQQTT